MKLAIREGSCFSQRKDTGVGHGKRPSRRGLWMDRRGVKGRGRYGPKCLCFCVKSDETWCAQEDKDGIFAGEVYYHSEMS